MGQAPDVNRGRMVASIWGKSFIVGLLLMVLGGVALSLSPFTGLVSIFLLGSLLVAGGVVEMISGIQRRKERAFLPYLLGGVLSIVVGALFLLEPGAGLASVSLLLAGFLLARGLFRAVTSVVDRYPNWGWDLFYGMVSTALGVVVLYQWPLSAMWVLGVLIGADLLVRGLAVMGLSVAVRKNLREVTP